MQERDGGQQLKEKVSFLHYLNQHVSYRYYNIMLQLFILLMCTLLQSQEIQPQIGRTSS